MPKVAIYSDQVLTFTAYPTKSISKYDVLVEIPETDWAQYQRIEKQYIEWQERLKKYNDKGHETGPKCNGKRTTAKVKAG